MGVIAEIASAYVSLLPSAKGFGSKLDGQIGGEIQQSGKKHGLSFGKLFAVGAGLGIGAKAVSFFGDSLAEGREAEVIGARTENVIRKMGNAANISAAGVGNLAGAISKKVGIDDEAIQAGQNLLLTFGHIRNEAGKGNDIFNQTTKLMVDMSAAMGTDAKGSAIQLGKALNDPVKGVSALTRVGVSFTEQQKAQIKTLVESGNIMGAQKVILGEVGKQFGGAAKSMATESDKAGVAAGNLKEQIGTALIPVVDNLSSKFTTTVAPAISNFVTGMQTGAGLGGSFAAVLSNLGAAALTAGTFIKNNATAVASFGVAIGVVTLLVQAHGLALAITAAGGLAKYLASTKLVSTATKVWAAGQWLLNAALAANPIGIVIAALIALGVGLVIAYKKSATFRNIVNGAFAAVKATAGAVASFFTTQVPAAFAKVRAAAATALGWVKANWPIILAVLTGPFGLAVLAITKSWDKIKAGGKEVLTFIGTLPGKILGFFTSMASNMYAAGGKLISMLADGIRDKAVDAINALKDVAGKLKGLMPGSPIKWGPLKGWNNGGAGKRLMDLVSTGIKQATPKTVKAAQSAFGKIKDALETERDNLKSTLEGLKGDFKSLAKSVSSAFTGNLFEAVTASDFIANLMGKKGQLQGMLASFKTLQGWGLDPAFLSQLFASGNGGLITELAGLGKTGALEAGALFGEVTSLGDQLGNAVAQNDPISGRIDVTNDKLDTVINQLAYLGSDIGTQLNSVAAATAKKAKKKKKGR